VNILVQLCAVNRLIFAKKQLLVSRVGKLDAVDIFCNILLLNDLCKLCGLLCFSDFPCNYKYVIANPQPTFSISAVFANPQPTFSISAVFSGDEAIQL
jgi:hypothetical protein